MTTTFDRSECEGGHTWPSSSGPICPVCASSRRRRYIGVTDTLGVRIDDHVDLRAKDPSRPSAKKERKRIRQGVRFERNGSGRRVDVNWVIDHDADRYIERVVDVETGEVLRDVDEPLSSHRGGTEKQRR